MTGIHPTSSLPHLSVSEPNRTGCVFFAYPLPFAVQFVVSFEEREEKVGKKASEMRERWTADMAAL